MTTPPLTLGAHHIGLTVPDLAQTKSFLEEALGFQQVGEVPDYPAVFVSDGTVMLTLWRAENPETATPFDRRRNIGLHHLALKVADFGAGHRLRTGQHLARRRDRMRALPGAAGIPGAAFSLHHSGWAAV